MHSKDMIEQSIQSLKEQGYSDELIAFCLGQIEQSTRLYLGKAGSLHNVTQPKRLSAGVAPVVSNPESKLTGEQQWVIACGADVAYSNGYFVNDLTTGLTRQQCRLALGEQYDIDCAEEVVDSIQWLQNEGHRSMFNMLWTAVSSLSIKEVKDYIRDHVVSDEVDEAIMLQRLRNLRDTREAFSLLDATFKPNMLIWDYARIINLCRCGFDAGYLSREEALETVMSCGTLIAQAYTSWRHLSLSYQFARFMWRGFDEELFIEGYTGMEVLLRNAGSPWVTLQWDQKNVE